MKHFFLIFFCLIVVFSSCKKEHSVSSDPAFKLAFSADTILFDTVFTSLGSSTHHLKIYNNHSEDLNISEIKLMGGDNSRFRMNVDGEDGIHFTDKTIPANDSLYTFLNVTIDPNDQNTPFVIEDSILFVTNTNRQIIHLVAWGQNAHYIIADQSIPSLRYPFKIVADSLETTHWTNEKPYVVYGYALINSYGTLHIHEGTHVYFHDKSGILSWSDGQLIVEGSATQPVILEGDRLEPYFKNQPGLWDRIWLMDGRPGADHLIDHAIIRNAFIGIQSESIFKPTQSALRVHNTIVENHTGIGIYSNLYAIEANNTVIDNCGQYALAIVNGGDYLLTHCTIGNYWWNSTRTTTSVFFNNYTDDEDSGERYEYPFHLEMGNSIVYGTAQEEFGTNLSGVEVDTTYLFDHCLIKSEKHHNDEPGFSNCIFNQDPMFVNYRAYDYHLSDILSPAVGAGSPTLGALVPQDLDGKNRTGTPDLGAYQY
jgi:hypothetical protein